MSNGAGSPTPASTPTTTATTTTTTAAVATPEVVHLTGVDVSTTTLAALQQGAPAQAFVSTTLNTELKSALASAATKAGESPLVPILKALPTVDIASVESLTLQQFVTREATLPTDPAALATAQAAIAKISSSTTVAQLLGLSTPIATNPLFSAEVKKLALSSLLATSPALGSTSPLINTFISQYIAWKGPIGDFWQSLNQDASLKTVVPEIQLSMQLGALTHESPPMVAAIRSAYPKLASPRDLAGLSTTDWQNLITKSQIAPPASIAGATAQDKVTNYAQAMAQSLASAFPADGFQRSLIDLLAKPADHATVPQGAATFLKNATSFDILNTNLASYVAANSATAFNGIDPSVKTAVTELLAAWQRVARVTSDFPTASALVDAGYTSAHQIASSPHAGFLSRVVAKLGSTQAANAVYSRAQQIAGTASALVTNLRHALSVPATLAIGDVGSGISTYMNGPASPIPNWQSLFGLSSYCACSDCRSVYSAAAYFVDLLQFLDNSGVNSSGQSPLDVLLTRRPDLPYIKLNCVNTNTELPYVDLVNEILEGFVAWNGSLETTSAGVLETVAHDTPSDATAAELSVNPEYTNDDAYNSYLNKAIFPPTLPYDRWLDTARTYLNFLGSSLYTIEAACQTGAVAADFTQGSPSGIALACEFLNISLAECEILTGDDFSGKVQASPPPLYEYYGYAPPATASATVASGKLATVTITSPGSTYQQVPSVTVTGGGGSGAVVTAAIKNGAVATLTITNAGTGYTSAPTLTIAAPTASGSPWEQDIANVPTFLQSMEIAYSDLVSLLYTKALNPNESVLLQAQSGSTCNLAQTTIVTIQPVRRDDSTPAASPASGAAAPAAASTTPAATPAATPAVTPTATPAATPTATPAATPAGTVAGGLSDNPTLDLAHRFIRLWKKLGWAISDLDKTMTALQATDINQSLLVSLAAIEQLESALNLPLTTILTFWSNLDTDGRNSFYLSLFQNKAVLYPPDPAFQLLYAAKLNTTSPPSLAFPSPVFPNLTYNATTQTLSLTTSQTPTPTPTPTQISAAEQAQLLALSSVSGFQSAINQLASGSATDVSPVALPPISLPAWLNFDASAFKISLAGAMTDAQRMSLNYITDPAYQVGFDSLFKERTIFGTELVGSAGGILATVVTALNPPPIAANATSIPVKSSAIIPAVPFVISVGQEQMLVTKAAAGQTAEFGATWTVTRGYNGTLATTHNINDSFFMSAISNHLNAIIAALGISVQDVNAIRSYTGLLDVLTTTLGGNIVAGAATLSVASSAGFPAPPFVVAIDSELFNVTAVSGTTWTVTAGYNGTAKASHNAGATVICSALTPLNLANLSEICRYAFLAQGLGLSVSDLITVLELLGIDPFVNQSPAGTLAVIQQIQAIQASPFSIAQLNYLYRHVFNPNAGIAPIPGNINLLLTTLQAGIAAIAAADAVVSDPKGDLLVKQLAQVMGTSLAATALGLINGTGLFSTPLPYLLGIVLPAFVTYDSATQTLTTSETLTTTLQNQLQALSNDSVFVAAVNALYTASQVAGGAPYSVPLPALLSISFASVPSLTITYDSSAQQLRMQGPMTTTQQSALLAISAIPAYQAAIKNLYQQPISFITNNFAPFLTVATAINNLVQNPAPSLTTAQKVTYVAQGFMPYLQQIQSKSLIAQTLCTNLALDPTLGGLLLNTLLNSQVSPGTSATAMADFLALLGDGLSAVYYSTANWTGTKQISRVDPTINFNWGFGFPGPAITARPFSVTWTGFLMPQYTESYTFFVDAGDGYQLSVNNVVVIPFPATDLPPSEAASPPVALTAGQLYPITLQWFDQTASAQISLSWSSPSTPKAIIPQSQLFSGAVISSLAPIVNSYTLLYKVALLANTFPLSANDVSYFSQYPTAFEGTNPSNPAQTAPFNLNTLPLTPAGFTPALFNGWQRLNAVVALLGTMPGGDAGLLNVFGTAAASKTATIGALSPALSTAVVQATGWNLTDLTFLVSTGGFSLSDADFTNETGRNGIGLVRLQACVALLTRLGISAQQLFSWAAFGGAPESEELTAQDIQNTTKSKYDDTTWETVGKPLNDTIRSDSKAALIAYILGPPMTLGWTPLALNGVPVTTSDQLYEYFLIDVEMNPCMLTSRIVQASAAVQLFVQRCLMNLEQPGVAPSAIDATQWEWMQNFRVWQAARQVLVYPENWIVPTLRDDMTPFFQDLLNNLLQNPITNDYVEQVYQTYLYALEDVALLDVRGTFWQLDANSTPAPDQTPDATNDILHVFARTNTTSPTYYYRQLTNCSLYGIPGGNSMWTPWQTVNIDIQADHLVPVVWERRLYLFWPSFQQTSDPSNQSTTLPVPTPSTSSDTQSYALTQPSQDLSISINWSEYQQGGWSSKQTSPAFVLPDLTLPKTSTGTLDASQFYFLSVSNGTLAIDVYKTANAGGPFVWSMGQFGFAGCGGPPVAINQYEEIWTEYIIPGDTSFSLNAVVDDGNVNGFCLSAGFVYDGLISGCEYMQTILNNTPTPFSLMFPQQFFTSFGVMVPAPYTDQPFFYQDLQRNYFVTQVFPDPNANLRDSTAEVPAYNREKLLQPMRPNNVAEIFPSAIPKAAGKTPQAPPALHIAIPPAKTTPAIATATPTTTTAAITSATPTTTTPATTTTAATPTTTPATTTTAATVTTAAQPANVVPPPPGPMTTPSQVVFSMFFHPHVCTLIQSLNQYGLPNLLTLSNQALTNDNGMIDGMELYAIHEMFGDFLGINPGILTAQGVVYEFAGTNFGILPSNSGEFYLYYNASMGPGEAGQTFYYNATQSPTWSGDAYLGSLNYEPQVSGSDYYRISSITGPTVFEAVYQPDTTFVPPVTFPHENIDFSFAGAYSIYNWELFFHIPILIATQLSQNQQFQDAQSWFHYVFNPTINSSDKSAMRWWRFLPFYECSPWDVVQGQVQNVFYPPSSPAGPAGPPPSLCGADIADQIAAWSQNPFDPFLVARMRSVAFRMYVVMAYLDNLIAWGDSLFAQNTREAINEATQIYIFANDILGPKPVQIPQQGVTQDYTYNDLKTLYGIDVSSNALVQMENDFPYLTATASGSTGGMGPALGMSSAVPYFCFPPNSTLLGYWDTVADRLYKIRNCMNIQGVVEQLALFAPPISPALLVAAAAAGVSISSVLSNSSAGTPFYRFRVMIQKALELCGEVRSLGAGLLAALEKEDAEALALLRATQELSVLQATVQVKQTAIQEAQANVAALQASLQTAQDRNTYYQGLVNAGYNSYENNQLSKMSDAETFQNISQGIEIAASPLAMIPNFSIGIAGFGGTPNVTVGFGGSEIAASMTGLSRAFTMLSSIATYNANVSGLQGQWSRRSTEWAFQAAQASDQIIEINSQIQAANFRLTIAQEDLTVLTTQITNAQAVQDFLTGKFTNTQLYSWMIDQISTVFFQCYQMAYDLATQAEAAFRFERALATSSYIQFGYWDSLKKGLLSGERLYSDLKRLEIAFLETDVREYEISKSVSLVLFDPWALITLKQTGQCQVNLPEAFFDMDYPGHYFRRLKSVSLTIPCVTGPYTSVNCTLSLVSSKIRIDSTAASKQDYANDAHFITNYASTQSIATSTAQNDSGLFEVNFNDERYLPFEGAGLVSSWQIDMPIDCNDFDFDTITDVVLNLRFTSRYGGDNLRDLAKQVAVLPRRPTQTFTGSQYAFPAQTNTQRLFSLRHEFPSEWYKFLNPPQTAASQSMSIVLGNERFPFQYRGKTITITQAELVLVFSWPPFQASYQQGPPIILQLGPPGGTMSSVTLNSVPSPPGGPPSFLGGAGYGLIANPAAPAPASAGTPKSWTLEAQWTSAQGTPNPSNKNAIWKTVQSGGTTYYHLNPAAFDDIFLICQFTAK